MSSHRPTSFAHAENTAHHWLATISDHLGTTDSHLTYRCTRAWLHAVRDHLSVDSTAKLAAQLPELLRGVFYEGWDPSRVPTEQDATGFVTEFVLSARVTTAHAAGTLAAITAALRSLLAPGTLNHVIAQLPKGIRLLVDAEPEPRREPPRAPGTQERLERLENDVRALAEAVRLLARGVDATIVPLEPVDDDGMSQATRQARQVLLAIGRPGPAAEPVPARDGAR
ncbi:DUF2267 domain-containing protein [Allokutzneria albata]|uniref:Uncharacterized conserved protein, DUF2267 family n=1 Tax=Allokutzneria albata TaxID=211114 RepID=A0A1G9SJ34_ALLAB|nr:DUF2267 domain-containing protein [Allokutzneria albata]SDM35421.1 Uncharacterized conserved protein, DUF2267 family [Allokutzneria albata]